MSRALGVLLACALASPAAALEAHGFAEVGVRALDGPWLTVRPGGVVEHGDARLVIVVPMSLGPEGLRREEWDELTDLGRVVSRLELRGGGGRWRLSAGALSFERLGHGTVVSDFVTTLDPDHAHAGLRLDYEGEALRLEVLAGEVLAAQLLAARVAVRLHPRLELGLTAAGDASAPASLTPAPDAPLPLAREAPLAVVALDAGWVVHRGPSLILAPYLDGAMQAGGGASGRGAVHLGLLADLPRVGLALKLEGRRIGAGYDPEYFDAYYALERWRRLGGGEPKAAPSDTPASWGGRLEVLARLGEAGLVGVSVDGRARGPANAALHLGLRGGPFSGALHVAHRDFEGLGEALSDRGWIGMGEARWDLSGALWLGARAGRVWRLSGEGYRVSWDAALSLGASI